MKEYLIENQTLTSEDFNKIEFSKQTRVRRDIWNYRSTI